MNISERHRPGTASSRHALYGLALPSSALKALQKRGIYCTPGVSLEHQHLARRYVLRGVESGGAVSDMGRACAFVAEDGSPLPWLQPIHSIAVNGRHAILLAESMVRIEMLRSERTWELAITLHTISRCFRSGASTDSLEAALSWQRWSSFRGSLEGRESFAPGKAGPRFL